MKYSAQKIMVTCPFNYKNTLLAKLGIFKPGFHGSEHYSRQRFIPFSRQHQVSRHLKSLEKIQKATRDWEFPGEDVASRFVCQLGTGLCK